MCLCGTSGSSCTPGTKFSTRRALGKALYIVKDSVMGQFESTALLVSDVFSITVIVFNEKSFYKTYKTTIYLIMLGHYAFVNSEIKQEQY